MLKPCPFCGSAPHYAKAYDRVDCTNDECQMSVRGQMNPAQWNRRAPWKPEEIEALKWAVMCLRGTAEHDSRKMPGQRAATLERMIS